MDKYATHLPVIRRIVSTFGNEPIKVLEFGGGKYSTKEFLDLSNLELLVTYEIYKDWKNKLVSMFSNKSDKWRLAKDSEYESLISSDIWDIIFIDDGLNALERQKTITDVCSHKPDSFIIIHDYENKEYHIAEKYMEHVKVYTDTKPYTAVLWNGNRLGKEE